MKASEAELANLRVTLRSQHLDQRASAARIESEFQQAKLKADVDEEMAREGLISDLARKLSRGTAQELAQRNELEKERLSISQASMAAQLTVQEARVSRVRAQADLKRDQVDALKLRAGIAGVSTRAS